ncbi:MAG TPA: HAMP domain-containing protein, partial [Allocoleopsis sp.]
DAFSPEGFSDIDSDFVSTIDSQMSPFDANVETNQSDDRWQSVPTDQQAASYLDENIDNIDDFNFSDFNLDSNGLDSSPAGTETEDSPFANPFHSAESTSASSFSATDTPFTVDQSETAFNPFGEAPENDNEPSNPFAAPFDDLGDLGDLDIPALNDYGSLPGTPPSPGLNLNATEDETLFMGGDFGGAEEAFDRGSEFQQDYDQNYSQDYNDSFEETYNQNYGDESGYESNYGAQDYGTQDYNAQANHGAAFGADTLDEQTFVSSNDNFHLDEFDESDFPTHDGLPPDSAVSRQSSVDFLNEFDEFDDLGSLPDFDLSDNSVDFTTPSIGMSGAVPGSMGSSSSTFDFSDSSDQSILQDEEVFAITGTSPEHLPTFTQTDSRHLEPEVSVEQGWLAPLENAPLTNKRWIIAGITGLVSAVAVAASFSLTANLLPNENRGNIIPIGIATTATAGLAGFGVTAALGGLLTKQVRRTATDLQHQFDAVCQGNFNAKATVYSEDEFGQLATGFNQMARVILTTTSEAQRKAEEQEQAKEDLQRQVIRLLDDVEGAARGDLTVQAEVTADVLGAVADSFNLTIQNLREIVQQVKGATRQVTKSSTENEIFARSLSSDAL